MKPNLYAENEGAAEALAGVVTSLTGTHCGTEFSQNLHDLEYNPSNLKICNMAEIFVSLQNSNDTHTELFARVWLPLGERIEHIKGTIVLFHGYAEHSGRYIDVAQYFCERNFRVLALDHTHHGNNTNNVGYRITNIKSFDDIYANAFNFAKLVADTFPEEPMFVLGHSLGGLITFNVALSIQKAMDGEAQEFKNVKGILFSAPAFYLYGADFLNPYWKIIVWGGSFLSRHFPSFKMPGAPLSLLCHDKTILKATKADKRCYGDATSARFIYTFTTETTKVWSKFAEFNLPFFIVQSDGDKIVQSKGAKQFYEKSATKESDKEILMFKKEYHEVLNEPVKDQVLEKMVAFMQKKMEA